MKPTNSQLIGMLEITHINIALSAKAGKQKERESIKKSLTKMFVLRIIV